MEDLMGHPLPSTSWEDMIFAFLHDPPDKALDIKGHEGRARLYLEAATSSVVDRRQIKMMADVDAAIAERLPMPTAGSEGERAVRPDYAGLLIHHPLSAASISISAPSIDKDAVCDCIREIVEGLDRPRDVFLALWRLLPEKLAGIDPAYWLMPADTRVPDHTIWHHLDVTAAFKATENGGGTAFLSFSLGPVQEFIAAAKSVQDLWAGSMLLSWLAFNGMRPILESAGPTALIYPSMRGVPWMDYWMRTDLGLQDKIPAPSSQDLAVPCLPNRFLAVVPNDLAEDLSEACRENCRHAWADVAQKVHDVLTPKFSEALFGSGWDKRWASQINHYFSVHTSVFSRRDCPERLLKAMLGDSFVPKVRELADLIPPDHRPRYDQKSAGTWQALVEYAGRLLEAHRAIRHVPVAAQAQNGERVPKKCSLLGSFEQMGPEILSESAEFWKQAQASVVGGVRVRGGEQLCAVSLVKRFCGAAFFQKRLGLDRSARRFEDTATVAARYWLEKSGIDYLHEDQWNGQWLHWPRQKLKEEDETVPEGLWKKIRSSRKVEKIGPVPTYYGVLMIDGDDMGKWLAGELAPEVGKILHPSTKTYFESLGQKARDALASNRPVGPAMHAAISQALAQFAVQVVPAVVQRHKGTLIYSGGDDVLALLPTVSAVQCALELYRAFRGEVGQGAPEGFYRHAGRDLLMMGPKATLSAGLAVVHYKSDLRLALSEARTSEKNVKRGKKNALEIKACRRSGQHTRFLCPWRFVDQFNRLVTVFLAGASDRFAYHLAADAPTLGGLPLVAQSAAIRRHVQRVEQQTRDIITEKMGRRNDQETAGDVVAGLYQAYHAALAENLLAPGETSLDLFATLLQTASFLARGRDQ
jgi:CRISPR-associated protein Cmr2